MSLFLVGGGYDDSLVEVYDEFVSQARHHNADAPIAVVVAVAVVVVVVVVVAVRSCVGGHRVPVTAAPGKSVRARPFY